MKFRIVLFVLSLVGSLVSASMLLPALWAWCEGTPDAAVLFKSATTSLAICALAAAAFRPTRHREDNITVREAFAIVTFSWIIASVIGAVPYVAYGTTQSFTDGFFEAMSGFTTTGASILNDIESNPRGILLWRALTHWLGGMGIIVLSLTILPFMGGGMELYKAETPTPIPEKLTPRLQQTAVILWKIYLLLTALETAALMLCGTTFYEGLTHAFSTLATGGFSIYNDSIAHFHSPAIEWIIIVFMFLAGVNFTLHFFFLRGKWNVYLKDDEFRWYAGIALFAAIASTAAALAGHMNISFSTAVRHGTFQVVTLLTTTGFAVTDTLQWPYFVHFLLLTVMLIGGCAGSTGGGIKVLRFMMLARSAKNDLIRSLQPSRVLCVRLNGKPQDDALMSSVLAFFVQFVMLLVGFTLLLTLMGIDVLSALSGVIACLSNTGPALGRFGPTSNYAGIPAAGKWILSFAMLTGRLELTTVLMLFLPSAWRR
ncbi:MAG: TrkH family potassium uptake protein [Pyramidobacter sp.]|jgi:trk system potassium uptake protein TrkH